MVGLTRWEKNQQVSARVAQLRAIILNTIPEIGTDRARLVTESYRETIGQSSVLRRAKALEKILSGMKLYILDGELIVGNLADTPRGAPLFPEYDVDFLLDELDTFNTRTADRFIIRPDSKQLLQLILPNWQGNTVKDAAYRLFPPETREAATDLICVLTALRSGVGHMVVDYELALKYGLLQIIEQVEGYCERLSMEDPFYTQKKEYYHAVKIVAGAAIRFAERLADLAERLAVREQDASRKAELAAIAQNCRKVPAHPAATFWEALQSFWIVHLVLQLESNGHGVSPGRFDQYMYAYYQNDRETGRLSPNFTKELIHCLWVKFNDLNKVRDRISSIAFGGYPMYQNLILGGQTPTGADGVNELSYLCLEATAAVGLPQPSLSVRWYKGTSEEFLLRCCEVASYGTGMPAFYNDEILIPVMLRQGYQAAEARDYAIVGCAEPTVPKVSETWLTGGFVNVAKILELTIHNGYDPVLKKQYGYRTGAVENFKNYEDFEAAYFKQLRYYLKHHVTCENILDGLHAALCPTPFESLFIQDCLLNAKTSLEGGARYNFTSPNAVGLANVADALAVIKKLIYEERKLSWTFFKQVLLADYEGYEVLRQYILNRIPKYGNDDDVVDLIARKILNEFSAELQKYHNPRGGYFQAGLYSIACHVLLAGRVGATPDGRKRAMLLADGGVSCAQGRDRKGPTALIQSVAKLDHLKSPGGALLNLKLNPEIVRNQAGLQRMAALIKGFFLLKGQHIQFNVIDAKMLRQAQAHPEEFPLLVVRVAGFSVLFTTIDRMLQDDIILRTEHSSFA